MRKQILQVLIASVVMSLFVLQLSNSATAQSQVEAILPWLYTQGRYVTDMGGRVVVLHGVSLDIMDITNRTTFKWRMKVSVEETIALIKELGAKIIRLAIDGALWWRSDYVNLVDTIISLSAAAGMYVTIDFHELGDKWDVKAKSDMIMNVQSQQPLLDFWDSVARRYRNQPAVLYGSILNEPWKGDYSLNDFLLAWYKLALKVSRTIHTINPRALILVGTLCGKNKTMLYFDEHPLPEPNIVYVWHDYYANDLFFPNRRFQYALDYAAGNLDLARKELAEFVKNAALFMSLDHNLPILMEEFGSTKDFFFSLDVGGDGKWHPVPNWNVEIQDRYNLYREYGLSWIQWVWKRKTQAVFGLLKDDGRTLNPPGELLAADINKY